MRKSVVISTLLGIGLLALSGAVIAKNIAVSKQRKAASSKVSAYPGYAGENMVYDVRMGKLYLGKAAFNYLDDVESGGVRLNYMSFETKVVNFDDLEQIYSDPENFLPVKIIRDINGWGIKENITEDYDQQNFSLNIKKIKGGSTEKTAIKKATVIHNAVLLPFHVRRVPDLKIGWTMDAHLPTQEFRISLVSIDRIKVPAGDFEAYHFISDPAKFEIWITTDSKRLPVKIKGAGALGYTLLMRNYSVKKPSQGTSIVEK